MSYKKIYDYIIIGAGTAGGIIAKELTDDKCTSALVLEAGTNMTKELSGASNVGAGVFNADNKFSFNMLTKLEPTIGNRQLRISSGRTIGGSSEHNAMYAVRGSKKYYDEIGGTFGPQWNYNSLRPLFIKNETYTGNTQDQDERGRRGPIFVRQQMIPKNGLTTILANATSDVLNIPIVEDYNTGIRDCTFYKSQILNKKEDDRFVRSSTATGYLNEEIVTQGNQFCPDEYGVDGRDLVILAKTTVNNIIFFRKERQNIAVGVNFVRNGVSQKAFARKGIVLSAGNFSSLILQRSGIGKSDDLAKAGISTLVESPNVGHNFITHFIAGMGIEVETSRLQALIDADPDLPFPLGAFKGEGPTGGRRLQIYSTVAPSSVPAAVVVQNNWAFDPAKPSNVMGISIYDLTPKSNGTIMIAHSDPEAYPSLNLNPLSDPDGNDLNFMIDRYIEVYNIMNRARQIDPDGIYKVVYPSEKIFEIPCEAEKRRQLAKFVRASYGNTAHFGGQCRMGSNIQEGVVDGFLNVFGTKNLKVADLSISPILQDGNNTLPVQITGLNAVRFIKNDMNPCVVTDEELVENFDCKE
ncbi:choline dehydrogenase [Anaerocolumna jejuensis DSM 15929]|uniref:Choline dehydrogenase n=1 Tax=Anaerocolumna jejuensis DSM 15929 TaxID=1121322 RepID=A0A1M6QAB2_9FIRM|nr:GMC family oxidoreductase [Anaerocolumna jejuensis]SHK17234.1 choline dehydrogenase [Anaerocolumna jejuensis DSM 15929]